MDISREDVVEWDSFMLDVKLDEKLLFGYSANSILERLKHWWWKKTNGVKQLTFTFDGEHGTYAASLYVKDGIFLPAPTLIFTHGFLARTSFYTWIAEWITSLNMICVFFDTPSPWWPNAMKWGVGFKDCFDKLWSEFRDYVDFSKIAIGGHSMGGLGAVIAASKYSNFRCAFPMAPAVFGGAIGGFLNVPDPSSLFVPTKILHGTTDGIVKFQNSQVFFEGMVCDKELSAIDGVGHMPFMNKGLGGFLANLDKSLINVDEVHDIIKQELKEWFDKYLV